MTVEELCQTLQGLSDMDVRWKDLDGTSKNVLLRTFAGRGDPDTGSSDSNSINNGTSRTSGNNVGNGMSAEKATKRLAQMGYDGR